MQYEVYPNFGSGGECHNFIPLHLNYAHFHVAVRPNDIHIYLDGSRSRLRRNICLVLVPVLATPLAAALGLKDLNARPLMETASVIQTAICGMTAAKMSTALHVCIMKLTSILFIIGISGA
jgi:hypothetical protein